MTPKSRNASKALNICPWCESASAFLVGGGKRGETPPGPQPSLCNAAASKLTSDDVVKLFIKWIDDYSKAHFAVIRDVYKHPGSSRHDIWVRITRAQVRGSAEADLFRLLIHDLSVGRVIRQHREKDYHGNFLKAWPKHRQVDPAV